jgi:anti-anti-sigma factor
VSTNVSGAPTPRRRVAACEAVTGRTARAARGGSRRCAGGRRLTTAIVRRDGGSAVVAVGGEIDVHTAEELRTVLFDLVDRGHVHVVADFSGVCFCDAAGLGALVAANNRIREHGGSLRLTGVRPAQRRILRITGLDRLFRPREGVGDALAT